MNLKGTLPLLILHVVAEEPNHGYLIAQQIKARSKGVLDFKEGTLYPTLHGLEAKGLLTSYEQEEKGRLRRYYKITQNGRKTLAEEREAWRELSGAVSIILKEA